MKELIAKSLKPFLIAIISAFVLSLIFFYPEFQGKSVKQTDIISHIGMSKESADYRETTGKETLWTNSMFGGMPTYQIGVIYKENIFYYVNSIFKLWYFKSYMFLVWYFIGFFILLYTMKKDLWLCIFGAIAFSLSTYFIIIIEAGHTSKAHAIGYVVPFIAGILAAYRGRYLLGFILAALFGGLHIHVNHFQITYYFAFLVFFLIAGELIIAIKQKKQNQFIKATGILLVAAIFALGPNLTNFVTTYNYSKQTMRGVTELTLDENVSTKSGLDKDYITQWSYGVGETFSLFIPNIKGGATSSIHEKNSKALDNVDPRYRETIANSNSYWGEQPFTSGPVYVGAFVFFLFLFSVFILKGAFVWSMIGVAILATMLAWGKNFIGLTDLFIDYFPVYNKFRAVSTFMVIPEFVIPLIAVMGLKKIYDKPEIIKEKQKQFFIAFGLSGGLAFIFYLLPATFFSFISSTEQQQFADFIDKGGQKAQVDAYIANLETARISILKSDAIRSFFFITLFAGLVWLWGIKKVKAQYFIAVLFVLLLADLIPVNKRYLNEDNFIPRRKVLQPFNSSNADDYILRDNAPHYRVLNLTVDIFNDASTSYFHKSIGGYHAAKLQRYQDLISYKLHNEIQDIKKVLSENPTDSAINDVIAKSGAINMLNTKYLIYHPDATPLINHQHHGNAWFVDSIIIVDNADEEMIKLQQINPANTAIVNKDFKEHIKDFKPSKSASAKIELTNYSPQTLQYQYSSDVSQCVLFSEIYYPTGWYATINGKPIEHFRANYVLRGMIVPAGEYTIEFKFDPKDYKTSKAVASVFSILFIIVIFSAIVYMIRQILKPY